MSKHSSDTVTATPDPELQSQNEKVDYPVDTKGGKPEEDPYRVVLDETDDPKFFPNWKKWVIICVISSAATCVACSSSMASFSQAGISKEFNVPMVQAILTISMFIEGLGMGPLVVGPMSEVYGRNIIYKLSFLFFFAFSWPVSFAPNIAVLCVFRFITGLCGSAFLSVAGGSVGDLHTNATIGTPMAIYSLAPFLGPVAGPIFSGFINQNVNWRWTYHVITIWCFTELCLIFALVPETYEPILLQRKAAKLRKDTGDDKYWSPLDRNTDSLTRKIIVSCYTPFQLIIFDRMALLLDLWISLILGIIYLTFEAFPIIFQENHGFNEQMTGLSFCGIGFGMVLGLCTQPFWNKVNDNFTKKHNGNPPPEGRLLIGMAGAICIPISLYWLAFTTYPSVHWIVPIIAAFPFGSGVYFAFTSVFTYLVVAYRPIAASAMAGNSFMRSSFGCAFPLFAGAMYHKLGTVGATALLAGLTTLMAPLPFIFYRIGGRLREQSPWGAKY